MASQKRKTRPIDMTAWDAFFPKDQSTEEHRLRFLTRMGYISFAHYLMYRNLVPVGVYRRRRFEDIFFYCFDSSKRWGSKLSGMMTGMRNAIENKYLESAFIMINESKENPNMATEVFTVRFVYDKKHELSIVNHQNESIISMRYKDENSFRSQAKQLIKKLNAVTKKLKKLNPGATPQLKFTYYPDTPEDYQPPNFVDCIGTYTWGANKPTFFDYGYVSTNQTAVAFHLESVYITKDDIGDLEDALYDEAGIQDKQQFDANNISIECYTDNEMFSPRQISMTPEAQGRTPSPTTNKLTIATHVSESLDMGVVEGQQQPEQETEQQQEEIEMDTTPAEIEMQREDNIQDANAHGPLLIDSPPSEHESPIKPDETMETPQKNVNGGNNEEEQLQFEPRPASPNRRILTPRLHGSTRRRANLPFNPKASVTDRAVLMSPEDLTEYPTQNN